MKEKEGGGGGGRLLCVPYKKHLWIGKVTIQPGHIFGYMIIFCPT